MTCWLDQTITELQHERKEGQPKLDKTNPFDALNDENVNTEQQQAQGKSLTSKICKNNKCLRELCI